MNHRDKTEEEIFRIVGHVYDGSIALLSACILIITLFEVADKRQAYFIDEVLCVSSLFFTISMMLSYFYLRGVCGIRYRIIANVIFVIGLVSILVAGIFLIMEY
jgi:hypothetical protein